MTSVEFCRPEAQCCYIKDGQVLCNRRYKVEVIEKRHLPHLHSLVAVLFPVYFAPEFYRDVLTWPLRFMVEANRKKIATLCARVDISNEGKKVYIAALGVSLFWRKRGIAQALIRLVDEFCKKNEDITSVYLHVQESNDDARAFYLKNGFAVIDRIENYYYRSACNTALMMEKLV